MTLGSTLALVTDRIVAPVQGMHRAISRRWFNALGGVAKPVQQIHDSVSDLVYGSIRVAASTLGLGIDAGERDETPRDAALQAFANGFWGDDLGTYEDRLSIAMGIRDAQGASVPPDSGLADTFPAATGNLVVLVHGLIETERCWQGTDTSPGLADTISHHAELTPVAIRYNTGLRVSDNGHQLASLIESACRHWPVPVTSIALVGNSMGGLVVRSACASGREAGHGWIDLVRDVVTLGSPHHGTPLEKLANVASWGLNIARETRPLADFLNRRSAGIKDLRFGAIVDEDWNHLDPDALLRNGVGDHTLPAEIDHHFVGAVITSNPSHPVGFVMGDLLVRVPSSTAEPRLDPTSTVVVGGLRHTDLPSEPAVIEQIMRWLNGPPA